MPTNEHLSGSKYYKLKKKTYSSYFIKIFHRYRLYKITFQIFKILPLHLKLISYYIVNKFYDML